MGNVRSVAKAIESLGEEVIVSENPNDLRKADRIVLPGVGSFGKGICNLKDKGFLEVLKEEVLIKKKPFLGICLGMQLLAKNSTENGFHEGLGWVPFEVRKFEFTNFAGSMKFNILKVPHMGWNDISFNENCVLFKRTNKKACFYFVHSYYLNISENNKEFIVATCDYGLPFVAAIQKDNIFATQFHPEKSQRDGLNILSNFIDYQYQ